MRPRSRRKWPTRSPNMIRRTTAMREAFVTAGVRVRGRVGIYHVPAWQLVSGERW